MSLVGVATVDVTPPAGLAMSGFLARTSAATGTHRSADRPRGHRRRHRGRHRGRLRAARGHLPAGPRTPARRRRHRPVLPRQPGRRHRPNRPGPADQGGRGRDPRWSRRGAGLGGPVDPGHLRLLEDACVDAVRTAVRDARPARLRFGTGADPGVARNRRRPEGPIDPALPVLVWTDEAGATVAVVSAYACHPVVLGADNTLWTADYPGVVRRQLELAHPGAVAVVLTGCCGDANTGHSAHASTLQAGDTRTYAACERTGTAIAQAVLDTRTRAVEGPVGARSAEVDLDRLDRSTWSGRVSVLELVRRPAGRVARRAVRGHRTGAAGRGGAEPLVVFGYADGCPGYFPTREEYPFGGYEVEEAHFCSRTRAAFAPGSAERLGAEALRLLRLSSL